MRLVWDAKVLVIQSVVGNRKSMGDGMSGEMRSGMSGGMSKGKRVKLLVK